RAPAPGPGGCSAPRDRCPLAAAQWRARCPWRARPPPAGRRTGRARAVRDRGFPRRRSTRTWPRPLGQPALAPAVKLGVAKALAAAAGDAEVELLDVLVAGQVGRAPIEHHAPVLQDVAVVGVAQRDVGVLLGQQEADPLALVE